MCKAKANPNGGKVSGIYLCTCQFIDSILGAYFGLSYSEHLVPRSYVSPYAVRRESICAASAELYGWIFS